MSVEAVRQFPRIKEVRAYVPEAVKGDQGADCHDTEDEHWINGYPTPVANPMSMYELYQPFRKSWGINAIGTLIVEVETDDGTCGVGVTIGGEPGCYIVEKHLSRFVEGQDPRNVELMYDQMFRATINYGRKGLPVQAISAVDLALWDLLGKLRKEPVYALLGQDKGKVELMYDQMFRATINYGRKGLPVQAISALFAVDLALWDLLGKLRKEPVYALLGGKTKERLPVYCTSSRPDISKKLGFVGAKIPCPYGPAAGKEGLNKNIEFYKSWRAKVGEDFPLMLDCYMALTVPYATRLAKELEPYGLKWMEEFLPPDDYEGYKEVRENLRGSKVLLSTGEHEYNRYGFKQLINARCVDIIQPDITWLGGITEARRVVAMAASHDTIVIPHGSGVYSYHLQYAFSNCPVAEFINLSPNSDKIVPYFGGLFPDEPLPANGFIDLPEKPGFGVTLNRSTLKRPYTRSEQDVKRQADVNRNYKGPSKAHMPF